MFVDLVGSTALAADSTRRRCVTSSGPTRTRWRGWSPLRRPHRQVHGRRGARYFGWPTAHEDAASAPCTPRSRSWRRSRRSDGGGRKIGGARRNRHRAGRGRRPGRHRRGPGAHRDRRDAEPCRPPAGVGCARTASSSPRARGVWSAACSRSRTWATSGSRASASRRAWRVLRPGQGRDASRHCTAPPHSDGRARAGDRAALTAGGRPRRRGPGGPDLGRAGHRQVALVQALRQELSGERHPRAQAFLLALSHQQRPLPISTELERAAGFAAEDQPAAKLAKLEALLAPGRANGRRSVPLIAALLGIPPGERYPTLNLSPQRQKQRTLEMLLDQLAGLARAGRCSCCTRTCIGSIRPRWSCSTCWSSACAPCPSCSLITFRPEFTPAMVGPPHVTSLPLNRLGRRDSAAMIGRSRAARLCRPRCSSRSSSAPTACRCSSRS